MQPAVRGGNPVLAGIMAGTLLAVLWMLLVWFTHNPVSLAGWGVGGLIGITLSRRASASSSRSLGALAAVLTVGTVVLAKAMILGFALKPIVRDEMVRNHEVTSALFAVDMTIHRSFSPDLQAALDEQAGAPSDTAASALHLAQAMDLSNRVMAEARARDSTATRAQREQLVRRYSDSLLAREGSLPSLGRLFGFWDLVWLGLGVSSAWQLARSRVG